MLITEAVSPLDGLNVVEFGGIGPGPFAGMVLGGMGAEVHRIDRPGANDPDRANLLLRGRTLHELDLKSRAGVEDALQLVRQADVLVECFRPGVMERLGLGPERCWRENRGLVYARMTGWGQTGPYASMPGHDINFLAISGVLNTIGSPEYPPVSPVNYIADYGAGGMMLVGAVLAGIFQSSSSGRGVLIDAAMVDGAAMMLADIHSRVSAGAWSLVRGSNDFDGGSPFYRAYETADGRFMAVGAVEPAFYAELLRGLGLSRIDATEQYDRSTWAETTRAIASVFISQDQAHWVTKFMEREACVSPVLNSFEVLNDPHLSARRTFSVRTVDGAIVPSMAPRFAVPSLLNGQSEMA